LAVKFPNAFKCLEGLSLLSEQRAFFGIAGKSSEGLRMRAGSGFADSTSAVAGAAVLRRMEPDARRHLPVPETGTGSLGNKGRF
jgi:hypothetical protein